MLELFLTTLVILLSLLGFFYLFGTFKIIQTFLYVCQLIFAIVLVNITLYKKHILMYDLVTYVHNITFNAINKLELVDNNTYLQMKYEPNLSYSTINYSNYSNECLDNYFISNSTCPITDIIIVNEKKYNLDNYEEIKINDTKYLYYTMKKKDGKLYKFLKDKMSVDNLNFEPFFNFNTIKKIKKVDEDRANNSFSNFKNFIYYGDLIIFAVISQYIFFIFIEPYENRVFDYNKIFNIIYELAILIFYIIRYTKFSKFRNFLFENEDIYKDKAFYEFYDKEKKYYFPNKVFNLDSFPISISINILLIRIIYLIFPQKWHYFFKEENNNSLPNKEFVSYIYHISKSKIICLYFLFFLPTFEGGLFGYYDNLMYNWNTNPIKSIELSDTKDYEIGRIKTKKKNYKFYKWRGKYFKIEKIKNLNYINIYKNENEKICGKDSYGNDLYFPNDVECPINDIIIDNNNKNYEGYKEIQLDNGKSLYYTNKNITKKILIDLKAHPIDYKLNLNLKKTNKLCEYLETFEDLKLKKCKEYKDYDIDAYIKIDDWDYNSFLSDSLSSDKNIDGILNFVGITYFGFDPSSIKERKKIKTLERNLNVFKTFFILQIIFFVLSTILVFSSFLLIDKRDYNNKRKYLIFIIIPVKIIIIIFEIFMYLFSLIIRIKYIHNFIFKIIYKDEKNEKEYKGIICFYIIILIALFSLLIAIINFYFHFFEKIMLEKKEDNNQSKYNEINERNDNNNLNTEKSNINDKKKNDDEISKSQSHISEINL